ncbi:MAG: hypothetical protein WA714_02275, partial [Candidatus Acidiferrales bacterium]
QRVCGVSAETVSLQREQSKCLIAGILRTIADGRNAEQASQHERWNYTMELGKGGASAPPRATPRTQGL